MEVPPHLRPQDHTSQLLFNPAKDEFNISYHSFRIPSIVRSTKGTLIAFAEGRQCSAADYGNINLVYKRSFDDGKTWTNLAEVVGSGAGTWGNPTAVVDEDTGTIWLFMNWNAENISQNPGTNPCTGNPTTAVGPGDRPVYLSKSTDDGATWTKPVNMTATLQPNGNAWDAVGPGVGIYTSVGATAGRLIVPAIQRNIYSDDHGVTWKYKSIPGGTSEGTVVELSDGKLQRNDRATGSRWNTAARRWLSTGTIEGSFPAFAPHDTLLDPRVEGSAIRYSTNPHRIFFLNPASTVGRCKMRVRISYDDGATWPISRQLHDTLTAQETCDKNLGGYSSMTKTADFHVAALVERIEADGSHRGIEVHRFNLPWVLDGTPEP
ncbi:MAG: exo-alpha-sialidase [Polyangiaceae bacterium]|nr:exo-alpha-sialidase [Polyangiaceae bacterium]MCB9606675.1 exo-alpha-sialidase [Polyangiaceae bacterium]